MVAECGSGGVDVRVPERALGAPNSGCQPGSERSSALACRETRLSQPPPPALSQPRAPDAEPVARAAMVAARMKRMVWFVEGIDEEEKKKE